MANTTLYRKYRPKSFDEVLGQAHISEAISGQIQNQNISHAYLFAGSKGTGKTSIARIFAKDIGTEDRDIYEIDAASNRRIDDIRELRQSIQVLPFSSDYKVYIIDEVHMLTPESFNALLKSLEEPPAHVIFILATTELHKIPATIQSRCEIYHFRKPNQKILQELVLNVSKKEGFDIETSAADMIAVLGEGAFRDTLGTLQKVLHASEKGQTVTAEDVSRLTGAPNTALVNDFLFAVSGGDLSASLEKLGEVKAHDIDVTIFLRLVLRKMRAVLLLRFAQDMKIALAEEFTEDDFFNLEKLSSENSHINSKTLAKMLHALEETPRAAISELPTELALIDIFGHNGEQAQTA